MVLLKVLIQLYKTTIILKKSNYMLLVYPCFEFYLYQTGYCRAKQDKYHIRIIVWPNNRNPLIVECSLQTAVDRTLDIINVSSVVTQYVKR